MGNSWRAGQGQCLAATWSVSVRYGVLKGYLRLQTLVCGKLSHGGVGAQQISPPKADASAASIILYGLMMNESAPNRPTPQPRWFGVGGLNFAKSTRESPRE